MYQSTYLIRFDPEDRSEYRRCKHPFRDEVIDGLSEAETQKWEAIIAADWEELTTIEAAEARIAELRRDGIGTDPGENWIIESMDRRIGTIWNFDGHMLVKQRIQEKKHTYYWACDCNGGWEEIPKYLFDALNRFEDERQKSEAEG